jgi:hypothetical protein
MFSHVFIEMLSFLGILIVGAIILGILIFATVLVVCVVQGIVKAAKTIRNKGDSNHDK